MNDNLIVTRKVIEQVLANMYSLSPQADALRTALATATPASDKDAERYRWLRDTSSDHGLCAVNIEYWSDEYSYLACCEVLDGKHLDAAIDAAMGEK